MGRHPHRPTMSCAVILGKAKNPSSAVILSKAKDPSSAVILSKAKDPCDSDKSMNIAPFSQQPPGSPIAAGCPIHTQSGCVGSQMTVNTKVWTNTEDRTEVNQRKYQQTTRFESQGRVC